MSPRPVRLVPPVVDGRDHALGPADAELTLVEFGSYTSAPCHAVHEVIKGLRDQFGERLRYVFRHRPDPRDPVSRQAAELAEYAHAAGGNFWEVHEALMEQGPALTPDHLRQIAEAAQLPAGLAEAEDAARRRVDDDVESAGQSGALVTPTFHINGVRYTGAWDESSLTDALLGPLGHRIQSRAFRFVNWGPSSGLLLGLATVVALIISNTALGPAFASFWETPLGFVSGDTAFVHSIRHWVNHGLLTVFFFVVGLEIKREFTVGHLASVRSGALPVMAAIGGIALPALIFAGIAPPELRHGWGIPIGTDTAFAVALIVLLGDRVPVELRVFLTAAVIIDDVVAIALIALFYSGALDVQLLLGGAAITVLLLLLNRARVYAVLPYAVGGVVLWFVLHEAGLHATLAGVLLAMLIPARPPANLRALMAQASMVIHLEDAHTGEAMRTGPSAPARRALNTIHSRIESPADKLLHSVEPWSSYLVLPVFALANADVVFSSSVFDGRARLIAAVALGLVVGKPVGMLGAAWLAARVGIADKPEAYTWRQLAGAGALGGIGFTMSIFIAGVAFPDPGDYAAAKIAILLASLVAGGLGAAILMKRVVEG